MKLKFIYFSESSKTLEKPHLP